ncbi:hypothetical protein [Candidatus Nanobsidianus stetteri]|uniref:Uncharacterized protein n=1 Tax=Nanobsidianus stetteri TaxID=1294122 RepID=A0A2T9WLF1_NANST|nr:hypothetical protein [Candidatus Nanobsidianus stetteri]MCC5447197.1 hypothetical protein [Candidatus Nanobsidianus stetteri]
MRGDFLRIIFDIIVLIVLVVLIYFIIVTFIGVAMGNDAKYIGYLNSIANDINNGGNGEVFINNYDYNYVFVLTNNNGWYLQLYHCFPPNQVVGLLSVKVVYWNVSTTDNGNTIIFAPALVFCKLVKQISLNSNINQININIQGLNDNAGLLAYSTNNKNLGGLQIFVNIIDYFFPESSSFFLTIVNDTTITCNDNGCTFTSTIDENGNTYQESGSISCAPSSNINSNNNNLPYNPSVCVELSGFPENPQIQLSNLEGEIVSSETFTYIIQYFQINFPLLYFAGSLPPTVMDIEVNSNGNTANINIYIGETVST